MNSAAQRLADDVLALPEEDRVEIYVRLGSSLPMEKTSIAESVRRAEELRSGKVIAMTETDFQAKMASLRGRFRQQA